MTDPYAAIDPTAAEFSAASSCSGNPPAAATIATTDPNYNPATPTAMCVSSISLNNGTMDLGSNKTIYVTGNNANQAGNIDIKGVFKCASCTIILTNSNSGTSGVQIGTVDINGGAEIDMSAPTSGTYDGILFYQDRRAVQTNSNANMINGTSTSSFGGAMYFPSTHLNINGNAGLTFTCAQFVSWTVEFSGNSGISNTVNSSCDDGSDRNAILGRHVRLVA